MQDIKILGTGCANCKTLHSLVEQVVGEMQLNVEVTKEENLTEILKFDVMSLPAIVIDGTVKATGKLSKDEVKQLLISNL
ncbi:MAG: thioredoxin family protein [Paludibacteraceae bacterium]